MQEVEAFKQADPMLAKLLLEYMGREVIHRVSDAFQAEPDLSLGFNVELLMLNDKMEDVRQECVIIGYSYKDVREILSNLTSST